MTNLYLCVSTYMYNLYVVLILTHTDGSFCDLSLLIFFIPIKALPKGSDTLASSSKSMPDNTNLEMLAKSLKLVVPSSVKECRKAGAGRLSQKAENGVIKNSLVILQANIGRENPSHSEFVLCSQEIILLFPEMKDPLPSVNREAFKEWVSCWATLLGYVLSTICDPPRDFRE